MRVKRIMKHQATTVKEIVTNRIIRDSRPAVQSGPENNIRKLHFIWLPKQ